MSETASFADAVAQITGPGTPFEIGEVHMRGVAMPGFVSAPSDLRAFFDIARNKGDAKHLVYEDESFTYDDTCASVDAFAAGLVDRYGIATGDRVAIAMRNFPEWIFSYFAVTSLGAIAVALNAWWTTEELDYGLRDCGARLAIVDEERLQRITPLLDGLDLDIVAVRTERALPDRGSHWSDVVSPGASMPDLNIDPDADAHILYTSGTTGHPKGVVATHHSLTQALWSFACRSIANVVASPPKQKHPYRTSYILVVPLFHATGLIPVMLGCTFGGNKLVMMAKWDPDRALELIERERVTAFVGVPTQSHDLIESSKFATTDTSSLQSVGGGGAAAPPALVEKIDSSFSRGRPQIGYGMTETNAYGPGNSGDDYIRKPSSTGRSVPTSRLKIIDPASGDELPVGEVGEVCLAGPHLFRGYWNKPEETAEVLLPDGWLRTGDLGYVDDEGFLFLVDRAKDLVIRAGENISCTEVEAVVYTHGDVYECAAFGLPHERLGEELAVAIYAKQGAAIDPDAIRAHVAAHLAAFKVPSQIFVWDTQLPRNASGKILKRALRDAHAPA